MMGDFSMKRSLQSERMRGELETVAKAAVKAARLQHPSTPNDTVIDAEFVDVPPPLQIEGPKTS